MDYTFSEKFKYKHNNPYHDRLGAFDSFVMRDDQGEAFKGNWNQQVFDRQAPLCLEIGSGYGEFMMNYCSRYPQVNFIGLDYRFRRSFELARKLDKIENKNFRYLRARGERISYMFEECEIDHIFYFFPDPWPKTRHNKKRLFQAPFLESAYKVLKPGGKLFIKTDHDGYAQWMKAEMTKDPYFKVIMESDDLWNKDSEHFLASFQTKFEKIFISQGTKIKAFVLESKREALPHQNKACPNIHHARPSIVLS